MDTIKLITLQSYKQEAHQEISLYNSRFHNERFSIFLRFYTCYFQGKVHVLFCCFSFMFFFFMHCSTKAENIYLA